MCSYPALRKAFSGKLASGHLVSCRQITSGATSSINCSTIGMRRRTELMFQVTSLIRSVMGNLPRLVAGIAKSYGFGHRVQTNSDLGIVFPGLAGFADPSQGELSGRGAEQFENDG